MDDQQAGLITNLLKKEDLTSEERNQIIEEAIKRYRNGWEYVVRQFLPNNVRRQADHDDVLQQSLLNLDRMLQNNLLLNKQGADLQRILNRIVRFDAIDQFKRETNHPAVNWQEPDNRDSVDLPTFCIFEISSLIQRSVTDPSRDLSCRQLDEAIVKLWDKINQAAARSLTAYSDHERAILSDWLRGEPGEPRYKLLQEIHAARSGHEIRQLTFDFCYLPDIDRLRRESWRLMLESEQESAGVLRRIWPTGAALRLISDSRIRP